MLLRSCKIHEELADAKAENDALRDDVLPLVVVSFAHQSSLSVSALNHHRLGVDNAASPTGEHRWTSYFTLREGWSLCKNNWKNPEIY